MEFLSICRMKKSQTRNNLTGIIKNHIIGFSFILFPFAITMKDDKKEGCVEFKNHF